MNPSSMLLVFSLLLPSLLHSKSPGTLSDEGLSTDTQVQNLLKRSNNDGYNDEAANLSNQEPNYISTPGKKAKNRKLLVSTPISSTHTTSKKGKEKIKNSKNAKVYREGVLETLKQHEEAVDIDEMDYTSAARKPPIHN